MQIKKLEINGFKSLKKLFLTDLGNFGIIAGANGSGKSNIFDALKFISTCITQGLNNALTTYGGFEYIHCFRNRNESARTLRFYMQIEDCDIIYACGPTPMLKAVKAIAEEKGKKAEISMEQRMGCGIGACLVCVCKTKSGYDKVCQKGPVFNASEVEFE